MILCTNSRDKYTEKTYIVRLVVLMRRNRKKFLAARGITMDKTLPLEEYLNRIKASRQDDDCPVRRTLEILNGKWRTYVIYELCKKGTCRFGELKRAIPKATNTMLTSTLRDLERLGIVHREQFNEIPPHVEYSLTKRGQALLPVFFEIAKWGQDNLD